MKKNECIKKVKQYKYEYAINQNPFVKATKGVSSGSHGNLFEMEIKLSLNNYRFNGVAKAGKTDTRKKINNLLRDFEIKCNCTELATLDINGNIIHSILNKEYIIYNPSFKSGYNAIQGSYILSTKAFWNGIIEIGLFRTKPSQAQYNRPKELRYKDRASIQTFKNSMKKENALYEMLEQNGKPFKEWLKENNIVPIEI